MNRGLITQKRTPFQLQAYGPVTSQEQLQAYGPVTSQEQLHYYRGGALLCDFAPIPPTSACLFKLNIGKPLSLLCYQQSMKELPLMCFNAMDEQIPHQIQYNPYNQVYIVACHLSEGSNFSGVRTCGGLLVSHGSSRNANKRLCLYHT